MKTFYFLLVGVCMFISCASSQNSSGAYSEISSKVSEWRRLLKLSAEQVKQIGNVEMNFQSRVSHLQSSHKNYDKELVRLQQKRNNKLKTILSREQYIKLQAIESDYIKKVPVRFKENDS